MVQDRCVVAVFDGVGVQLTRCHRRYLNRVDNLLALLTIIRRIVFLEVLEGVAPGIAIPGQCGRRLCILNRLPIGAELHLNRRRTLPVLVLRIIPHDVGVHVSGNQSMRHEDIAQGGRFVFDAIAIFVADTGGNRYGICVFLADAVRLRQVCEGMAPLVAGTVRICFREGIGHPSGQVIPGQLNRQAGRADCIVVAIIIPFNGHSIVDALLYPVCIKGLVALYGAIGFRPGAAAVRLGVPAAKLISRADWVRQDIQLVVILLLDGGHAAIGVVRIPGDGILLRRPSRIVSGALLYYRAGYQRRGAVLVQIPASKVVSFAGRRSGGRHHDTVPLLGSGRAAIAAIGIPSQRIGIRFPNAVQGGYLLCRGPAPLIHRAIAVCAGTPAPEGVPVPGRITRELKGDINLDNLSLRAIRPLKLYGKAEGARSHISGGQAAALVVLVKVDQVHVGVTRDASASAAAVRLHVPLCIVHMGTGLYGQGVTELAATHRLGVPAPEFIGHSSGALVADGRQADSRTGGTPRVNNGLFAGQVEIKDHGIRAGISPAVVRVDTQPQVALFAVGIFRRSAGVTGRILQQPNRTIIGQLGLCGAGDHVAGIRRYPRTAGERHSRCRKGVDHHLGPVGVRGADPALFGQVGVDNQLAGGRGHIDIVLEVVGGDAAGVGQVVPVNAGAAAEEELGVGSDEHARAAVAGVVPGNGGVVHYKLSLQIAVRRDIDAAAILTAAVAGDCGAVHHNQAMVMDCAAALAGPVPYELGVGCCSNCPLIGIDRTARVGPVSGKGHIIQGRFGISPDIECASRGHGIAITDIVLKAGTAGCFQLRAILKDDARAVGL